MNILLKYARLYGFEHARTASQLETTWFELRAAVPPHDPSGLLLGAAGSQLLVDGVPLETGAERSFAQLLSAAGIASIHFLPRVTQSELTRLVRGFPAGRATPAALSEKLKTALAGVSGIRINELRFIAEDASTADAKLSAQLVARTMGADADQFREWLNDPQKLLQIDYCRRRGQGRSSRGLGNERRYERRNWRRHRRSSGRRGRRPGRRRRRPDRRSIIGG